MQAFLNDAALKHESLARLRHLADQGLLVSRPIFWNGEKGSIVGSLLRGDDVSAWEVGFGLPRWLALSVDGVLGTAATLPDGIAAGIDLLDAAAVGTDVSLVGSRFIAHLLTDAKDGLCHICHGDAMAKAITDIACLHERSAAGESASAAEWRALRRVSTVLTDGMNPGSAEATLGACIEAAAWDPVSSRSAVSDVQRCWARAMSANAMKNYGWTPSDDVHVKSLLDTLYAQAKASNPEAKVDVFQLFEQHHPEEAERLKARLAFEREQSVVWWRRAQQALRGLLQAPEVHESSSVPLIPRAHLFANPERSGMQISPDGQWLAWLANGEGVMNIWAAPCADPGQERQVTFDRRRGVQGFSWTYVPGLLLYSQDQDGDENWRIYAANVASGQQRTLTPTDNGVRASISSISRTLRDRVLITLNQRDPRYPDLYSLHLQTGALELVEENPGFAGFLTDDRYRVRIAMRSTPPGGMELLTRDSDRQWRTWMELSPEDARVSGPTHFSANGSILYFRDSRGRDTAALTAINLESGQTTVLGEDALADIGGTINDPIDYRPLAYGVTYERRRLHVLDESIRADIDFLDAQDIGEWGLSSRTEDNRLWLISASSDIRPSATWLYDRQTRSLTKLYDIRPILATTPLARMQPITLTARDGLKLVSYLTLPLDADSNKRPVPLVLHVHGGPWTRDHFGYNATHQWLANRGYAVLSVNFRSSTGFGKSFIRAGDGEWGRKMDEDLEDAVQWAIDQGIADPKRLAIFGGSYGGYAVLSALSRYPERYACGIDVVGPSNLETLLASIPPYWESARAMQYKAIGNPETPEGRDQLRARSPLHRATAVRAPLLIAQGANDPRVKQAESEQMVQALKSNGTSVLYALYSDEGHGFVREPNRMLFNALVESFLARHLGGRDEGWNETDFPGNTLRIVEGDDRKVA